MDGHARNAMLSYVESSDAGTGHCQSIRKSIIENPVDYALAATAGTCDCDYRIITIKADGKRFPELLIVQVHILISIR